MEETGVPGEMYHIVLYRVHLAMEEFELTTLAVIDTDCLGICKSNYHTITTMTARFHRDVNITRYTFIMTHI